MMSSAIGKRSQDTTVSVKSFGWCQLTIDGIQGVILHCLMINGVFNAGSFDVKLSAQGSEDSRRQRLHKLRRSIYYISFGDHST